MADCDDYEAIAAWGAMHLSFLRRYLPFDHGVPGWRWLTLLMNRINPALFSAVFSAWCAKTGRTAPILSPSTARRRAAATTAPTTKDRCITPPPSPRQAALCSAKKRKAKPTNFRRSPVLIERLAAGGDLKGALVSIDAIATNAKIAQTINNAGGGYLFAVKANQPTLRSETENAFAAAACVDAFVEHDKGHGRIEQRTVSVIKDVDCSTSSSPTINRACAKVTAPKTWPSSGTSPSTW